MKNWIRWQGLWVFVSVAVILAVFWLIVIDSFVKSAIQSYGTKAVGAKVEIEDVDVTIFPAGLALKGLAITNPDKPMENIVEIQQAAIALDTMNLLRRKIIVEKMALDGIRINTSRRVSGALKISRKNRSEPVQKKPSGDFCDNFSLPSFQTLNARQILSQAKLESFELIQTLQEEFQVENKAWQKRLSELPGKEQFDGYRQRIQKLKSGPGGSSTGFLGSVGDVVSLQEDIQRDIERIKNAQKQFERLQSGLSEQFHKVTGAPQRDVERLKQTYSLSPQGLENLGKLVLGQKLCGGLQRAMKWYDRLKFVLKRAKKGSGGGQRQKPDRGVGTDVRFNEAVPLPDFLVRLITASVDLDAGVLAGKINNITPEQNILGSPLTFMFSGDKLKRVDSVKIDGSLDHIKPLRPQDRIRLHISGYKAKDMVLSRSSTLPFTVKEGRVDFKMQAVIDDNALNGEISAVIKAATLSAGAGGQKGTVLDVIGSVISNLSGFNARAVITGTLNEYNIRLNSDLDRVLKSAVGDMVEAQTKKFEKALKQAILTKVNGPLALLKSDKNGFDAIGTRLTDRLNMGAGILSDLKRPF